MLEIKVYDDTNKEGEACKEVYVKMDGTKLDIMAELTLAVKDIIDKHFDQRERFAFLACLIQQT